MKYEIAIQEIQHDERAAERKQEEIDAREKETMLHRVSNRSTKHVAFIPEYGHEAFIPEYGHVAFIPEYGHEAFIEILHFHVSVLKLCQVINKST